MTLTRKLATLTAGIAAVVGLAACQPAPPTPPSSPPPGATVIDVQAGNPVYVRWSIGSAYCRGTVTVLEPGHTFPWEATGGPATGTTLITAPRDGQFAAWVHATDTTGRGRRCHTDLELVSAPTQ